MLRYMMPIRCHFYAAFRYYIAARHAAFGYLTMLTLRRLMLMPPPRPRQQRHMMLDAATTLMPPIIISRRSGMNRCRRLIDDIY